MPMPKPTCAIVILNYNGRHLLNQFLESVIIAANSAKMCNIHVVLLDNVSTDDSISWVQTHLPTVEIISALTNRYLYSYNWVATILDCDFLLFLNNDIEMSQDCLDPLFETLLSNSYLFSVTPQMYSMDRVTVNSGYWVGHFHRGELKISLGKSVDNITPTLFSSGGALLLRKNDFLSLGGFDNLYYPAYWEDIDLCYRAWKKGMYSYCQPASVMYHVHSASTEQDKNFQPKRTKIIDRNRWLFVWRNIAERQILALNLYWTLIHYISLVRRREGEILRTYHEAFYYWKQAISGRSRAEYGRILPDSQILETVKSGKRVQKD